MSTDHKWIPGDGPTSRNGLEQDELVAIPLVKEGVDVVFTSRVKVCKGEERVSVDVERLDVERSKRLKRLEFGKAFP